MRYERAVDTARYQAFANKMPTFYAAFVFLMLSKVYVFYGVAPLLHGVVIPCGIALFSIIRGVRWVRI